MFRFTPAKLSMSPYAVFAKNLRRNTPAGTRLTIKQIKQQYHALDKKQKAAFVRRAHATRNPNLDTFNQFQKRHAKNFVHLPLNARSRVVGVLFRQYKTGKPLNFAVAEKEARAIALKAKRQAKLNTKAVQVKAKSKQVKSKAKKVKKAKKPVAAESVEQPVVAKKTRKTRKSKKTKASKKAKKVVVGKKANKVKKSNKVKKAKKVKKTKRVKRVKRVKRAVVGKKAKKSKK